MIENNTDVTIASVETVDATNDDKLYELMDKWESEPQKQCDKYVLELNHLVQTGEVMDFEDILEQHNN